MMAVTTVTTYTCSDGKQFDDASKANSHEQTLMDKDFALAHAIREKAAKWLRTSHSAKRLLEKHKLDEVGVWRIRGEDANCDFGGPHHMPTLDTVEGSLRDVIEHAVNLRDFYTWGSGGDIEKITVKKIKKV